jgi:hypothetical protein
MTRRDIITKIPLLQMHKCGKYSYCDYCNCNNGICICVGEFCEKNNKIEEICLSPNEIPETIINIDKPIHIYDTSFKLIIDYRVQNPGNFTINKPPRTSLTIRSILMTIYDCLETCKDYDILFIEELSYNHTKQELVINWGS